MHTNRGLREETREVLAGVVELQDFAVGAALLPQGDTSDGLY